MAKITKHGGGIGAPTKEERMKEAANLHIKTGNIQRYCELMVELGQVTLCFSCGLSKEENFCYCLYASLG